MIDLINRIILWLIGLALTAAGVLGLQARGDSFKIDLPQPGQAYGDAEASVRDLPGLWWTLIIGSAAIFALLAFIWLRFQFVRRGGRGIGSEVVSRTSKGKLEIDPAPVAKSVAADLKTLEGVHDTKVRILAMRPSAKLVAQLDLQRGVDPLAVQQRVEEVIERMGKALGVEHTNADIRLRLAEKDSPRVA